MYHKGKQFEKYVHVPSDAEDGGATGGSATTGEQLAGAQAGSSTEHASQGMVPMPTGVQNDRHNQVRMKPSCRFLLRHSGACHSSSCAHTTTGSINNPAYKQHPHFPGWMLCTTCFDILLSIDPANESERCSVCAQLSDARNHLISCDNMLLTQHADAGHATEDVMGGTGNVSAQAGERHECPHHICEACFKDYHSSELLKDIKRRGRVFECPACEVMMSRKKAKVGEQDGDEDVRPEDMTEEGVDAEAGTRADAGEGVIGDGEGATASASEAGYNPNYNSVLGFTCRSNQLLPSVQFEVAWALECLQQIEGEANAYTAMRPLLEDEKLQQRLANIPNYFDCMQSLQDVLDFKLSPAQQAPPLVDGRVVEARGHGQDAEECEGTEEVMVYTATAYTTMPWRSSSSGTSSASSSASTTSTSTTSTTSSASSASSISSTSRPEQRLSQQQPQQCHVSLHRASAGINRRFYRKYGADRFLFISVDRNTESAAVEQLLQGGLVAGGRAWEFVVPLVDQHSRGDMRALFVAVKGRGVTEEDELTVEEVRGWHISPAANSNLCVSDYVKRFKLGLSQTVGTIVLPRSSITVQEDWVATETSSPAARVGAAAEGDAGAGAGTRGRTAAVDGAADAGEHAPMVMTEGCGFISTQAMNAVALRLGLRRETPSVIQARIGAAKGLWIRWDEHGETNTTTADGRLQDKRESEQTNKQTRGIGHAGGGSAECVEDGSADAEHAGWRVVLRKSQIKYQLPLGSSDEQQRTVEVCEYSSEDNNRPSSMNKQFIRILHQRGVPIEVFKQLQDEEVGRVRAKMKGEGTEWVKEIARAWGRQKQRRRRNEGQTVMRGTGVDTTSTAIVAQAATISVREMGRYLGDLGDIVCALLDAGFTPTHPLLRGPVNRIIRSTMKDKLCMGSGLMLGSLGKSRKKKKPRLSDSMANTNGGSGGGSASASGSGGGSGAGSVAGSKWDGLSVKMKLPVELSRNLLIAPDPSRTLQPGECAVRLGTNGHMLTGKVALARHPIYYHTCLRVATAVDVPALHHLPNVLFLSVLGDRPEADTTSGGA
jgi:hypothetical protein